MNTYSEDKMYENYSSEVERMQKCIDELQQENKQLKDNWNKLKEWVKEQPIFNYLAPVDIKNKMQKLQGSDSNE